MKTNHKLSFLLLSLIFLLSGCGNSLPTHDIYIPQEYEKKALHSSIDYGMHQGWINCPYLVLYDKIMINVVVNPIQINQGWWDSINIRNLVSSQKKDLNYVAEYTRTAFVKAFNGSTQFKLTDNLDSSTLKLNFAIVQVVPNKPILGGFTNILGITPMGLIFDPLKAGIKGSSESSGGAVAMETILTSPISSKIIAVFADREKGELALIFNSEEFTAYGNVREIIDHWTEQIITALDSAKKGAVTNPNWQNEFTFFKF